MKLTNMYIYDDKVYFEKDEDKNTKNSIRKNTTEKKQNNSNETNEVSNSIRSLANSEPDDDLTEEIPENSLRQRPNNNSRNKSETNGKAINCEKESKNNAFKNDKKDCCDCKDSSNKNNSFTAKKSENNLKNEPCYSCCFDTTMLRKILLTFQRNSTPVVILGSIFPNSLDEDSIFTVRYVSSVVEEMVYLSNSPSGAVRFIIPISNITFVSSLTSQVNELSCLINKILYKPTLPKNKCCGITGMANAISENPNVVLAVPLTGSAIGVGAKYNIYANWIDTLYLIVLIFFKTYSIAVNEDVCVFYNNSTTNSSYMIIPTCKIDYIYLSDTIPTNISLSDGKRNAPTPNELLSYLPENVKDKVSTIDLEAISKEVKGKSFKEVLDILKSKLN